MNSNLCNYFCVDEFKDKFLHAQNYKVIFEIKKIDFEMKYNRKITLKEKMKLLNLVLWKCHLDLEKPDINKYITIKFI
jgi:hypothetical protein